MARVAIQGFECGDNIGGTANISPETATTIDGTASIQSTTKRSGNYALRVNPTTTGTGAVFISKQVFTDWLSSPLTTAFNLSTVHVRFYFLVATAPSSYEQATNTQPADKAAIYVQSSGAGFIFRVKDSGGTNYDNATILNLNQWYRIEMTIGNGVGTGTIILLVDGVQWVNTVTANTTNVFMDFFKLGKVADTNGQSVDFFYDDVSIDDAALPGPGSIVMLYPNAAGTDQTWTVNGAATHFGCVDDWNRQNGDDDETTYLSVSLSGTQAEENSCLDFTGNFSAQSIVCLLAVLVQRNSSGSVNVGTPRLRSASTNSDGTAYNPGAAYTTRYRLFTTDPATSAAWTASGLDSVQIGFVKTQSQARAMRMTASAVIVEYVPLAAGHSFGSVIC